MTRLSAEERRSSLVQAALRVITLRGVNAATTRAIAAEAGMPLASFHYAFRSRDELIRELVAVVVEGERLATMGALAADVDIRSAIRAGLQAYFDLVVAEPGREQAMFELLHYSLRTPGLGDLPRAQYESYNEVVRELLRAGAEHANVTWTRPLDDLARLVVSLTDGITLGWLADRDDAAAARLMDSAADYLATLAEPRAEPGAAPRTAPGTEPRAEPGAAPRAAPNSQAAPNSRPDPKSRPEEHSR
jgi:DNA-binding transcriptional regulator YbjK